VRRALIAIAIAIACASIRDPARADPQDPQPEQQPKPKPPPKPPKAKFPDTPDARRPAAEHAKPIDVKPIIDQLEVYRDDTGLYYVSPRYGAFESWSGASAWVFVGDGKTMYQQHVVGSGYDSHSGVSWFVWSPRSKRQRGAFIELGQLYVSCGNSKAGRRQLVALKADEAKAIVSRATFYPPLWERSAHRLARDDDATYYYIDALLEELGGNGYRVFIGVTGAMKQVPLTNIAHDSGGEIFATKAGQLKIVFTDKKRTDDTHERVVEGVWIKGGKRVPLTVLEPSDNSYLIYRELGIYGALGTPCDDA
jgi:hypothetical protein